MNAVVKYEEAPPLSVNSIKQQIQIIQEVMAGAMINGTHYGVVPGCGDKPTLLKPGAEKLSLTFRLAPSYTVTERDRGNGHREYEIRCKLTHIPTDQVYGEGVGICSTMETKFRYRDAKRKCPACGSDAIIKGKQEYGGGWLCFAKKGGCGEKFGDDEPAIVEQKLGRAENPDIADTYNTVLKMAKKRAHVDAVLTATAASDIFAQDLEDLPNAPPIETEQAPKVEISTKTKQEFATQVRECLANADDLGLKQLWDEWDQDHKVVLWGLFNSQERNAMKKLQSGT